MIGGDPYAYSYVPSLRPFFLDYPSPKGLSMHTSLIDLLKQKNALLTT